MIFHAHTGSGPDKGDWQTQKDHTLAVAALAAGMARPFGLERAAHVAGLFHDLGKYTRRFQRRLNGEDIRVDHSTAGAAVLRSLGLKGGDKEMAELIAYCILGHHAGLPDRLNATEACVDARLKRYALDPELVPDPVWQAELTPDTGGLVPTGFKPSAYPAFQLSVMTRMIFSCLVDADYKDTETFYAKLENSGKDRKWPALQDLLPEFLGTFEAHMAGMGAADSDLNRLRGEILANVRAKSIEKPGLFTLTVPTGGGKTLASLGFALAHAFAHGHRRIIYAIPFVGAWIETARWSAGKSRIRVAPRVGAWIETGRKSAHGRACSGRPSRGGVDRNKDWCFRHGVHPRSPLAWGRGSKRDRDLSRWNISRVAPRVGAWIETAISCPSCRSRSVAPRVGAWIETP